jgi:alpha 1,6-mannosyltransferase
MINSRRAIVAAVFILIVFFLISRSHTDSKPHLDTTSSSSSTTNPTTNKDDADSGSAAKGEGGSSPASPNTQHQDIISEGSAGGLVIDRPPPPRTPRKPTADMSNLATYDKLAYAYPYDVTARFPAYIWQTWKQTPAEPGFQFREQEASWSEQHPGFVHEVITDELAVSLLRLLYATVPEVLEAYDALPLPVLKADFFRYLILYARGGIYSDIDTYAIQSALVWLPDEVPRDTVGLVIGIEADPDRPDWKDWYSRRIQFCQWTIQSKPGHPVLRDIIGRITKETLSLKRSGKLASFLGDNVVDLTGPAVWTDTIMDYFNDERYFDLSSSPGTIDYHNFTGMTTRKRVGDVVVLPITSFSPGVGQMGAKEPDDPMAFVKHDFEGEFSEASA